MSIDRWMDKEIVVHIYNGILLRHKKECLWVSSNKVDEPRACYTEWSKSEKEKRISYINTHIWCLNKWTERVTGNTYITICKTDSQWECDIWCRELKLMLWQPRGERWGGRWEEGSTGKGQVYTYEPIQINNVKQLSSN